MTNDYYNTIRDLREHAAQTDARIEQHKRVVFFEERRVECMFRLYEAAAASACAQAVQPSPEYLTRIAKWAEEASRIIHAEALRSSTTEEVASDYE